MAAVPTLDDSKPHLLSKALQHGCLARSCLTDKQQRLCLLYGGRHRLQGPHGMSSLSKFGTLFMTVHSFSFSAAEQPVCSQCMSILSKFDTLCMTVSLDQFVGS